MNASALLSKALSVQAEAQDLMAASNTGMVSDERWGRWATRHRALAGSSVNSPIDALVVAHTLLQCSTKLPSLVLAGDSVESLAYLTAEILEAASGLTTYLEDTAGLQRSDLGLHDDFVGPIRN